MVSWLSESFQKSFLSTVIKIYFSVVLRSLPFTVKDLTYQEFLFVYRVRNRFKIMFFPSSQPVVLAPFNSLFFLTGSVIPHMSIFQIFCGIFFLGYLFCWIGQTSILASELLHFHSFICLISIERDCNILLSQAHAVRSQTLASPFIFGILMKIVLNLFISVREMAMFMVPGSLSMTGHLFPFIQLFFNVLPWAFISLFMQVLQTLFKVLLGPFLMSCS